MATAPRATRAVLAVVVAVPLALGAASSAAGAAPQAPVLPTATEGTTLRVALSHEDGQETIDLAVTVPTGEDRVGLVLPTPTKAEISAGDGGMLARLDAAIAPRRVVEDDWWGRRAPGGTSGGTALRTAPTLGDTDARAVRGTSRSRINAWLEDNGLTLSSAQRETLAGYAERGWSFALVAFDAPTDASEVPSVRLRFATDDAVFPLALWAGASSSLRARFYVLGETRTELREDTRAGRPIDAAQSVAWAGSLAGTAAATDGDYLTVTDVVVDAPSDQITDDIRIEPAVGNDESIPSMTVYRRIELFGIPLGWLLTVWGGAGLALGVGWLSYRLRRR